TKLERRNLEFTSLEYLTASQDSILKKKLFHPDTNKPQTVLLKSCLEIIASTMQLMHTLNKRAAEQYDRTNKKHEIQLDKFWKLAMDNGSETAGEKLESRMGKQWARVGFQGVDPATDFRGMGCLGLDDLVYYAKNHVASFQRVLTASHHSTAWFSMAIVGINITSFTLSLVRQRKLQNFLYKYGVSEDVYHEFYCYVFDEFEKKWSTGDSNRSVMDFSVVFEELKQVIERRLEHALE
ncbi:ELMO domain-containing protein 2, partial [Podochytrium sp. JEL0797]